MTTFRELGVGKDYIKGLNELGIKNPTEVQEETIPYLLKNQTDFIGLAQTGTGKTAAYGLPVLHNINTSKNEIQALILSPTRELVQQIKKQLFKFTKYVDDRIFLEAVFGGEKIERQIKNLKRTTHIVIATPGRLIDLIERGEVDLKSIETLILDEADEMLSMGFKEELNRILKYTSGERKTWLFSATMPPEIRNIIKKYMSASAKQVEVNKNSLVNANITHQFTETTIPEKLDIIVRFLEKRESQRGIVFTRTKAGAQKLTKELKGEGFSVEALEGDMQQKERDKVMRAFKNENLQVLVSTDVAARGIDVRNLGFVVHHQLPEKQEYYTHRSGRTARAGKSGVSLVLILKNERERVREIERSLQIRISEISI
ncbi:ATP-dependent RNA helicase DeaD [Tenacibaculum sp. MAR_2009_124]|uniref:DEAD/DEAH box helicase n=1 Tax=Tenacibaculum sp. MAR_2009_124 TaxID=1250059 RepID=UPI000897C78F|nr:DEAD/DEAH box helicase [Tenacibaculum sp. MAR_2009_124]SEB38387.1 ATP-dependent RNA helicase DeaD [Tenacibaculum sp. MAR_2009_124]